MKNLIITALLVLISISLQAQSKQTIKFFVNSYRYVEAEYNKELEALCEGFEITITADKIILGDNGELKIISREYNEEGKFTQFWVEDKAKQPKICTIILYQDSNGENVLQAHECDSEGEIIYKGGILFKYWDYVSNYDLWRVMRRKQ